MWPVIARSLRGLFSEANPPPRLDRRDIELAEPYRNLDGEGHEIVGEHKALKRFVAQLVIPDRGNDERGGFGGGILLELTIAWAESAKAPAA